MRLWRWRLYLYPLSTKVRSVVTSRTAALNILGLTFAILFASFSQASTIIIDFDTGLDERVRLTQGLFSVDTSSGTLRLNKGLTTAGFNRATLRAQYWLIGDFEARVDFGLFEFPQPEFFNNQLQLRASTASDAYLIARQKGLLVEPGLFTGSIDGYTTWDSVSGVTAVEPSSSDVTGEMKINRIGDAWSFWYTPTGSGVFSLLNSITGPTDPVLISLDLQNNNTGDALDAEFDNFVLSATSIEPLPGAPAVPVPEPASIWILISSLGCLLSISKIRRRTNAI